MFEQDKKHVFGFDFISNESVENIAKACIDYTFPKQDPQGQLPLMITPNAAQIVMYHHEQADLKPKVKNAVLILPDGQPIVWTSRLIKQPLKARLTGSDFFPIFWGLIKGQQKRAYLILPDNKTATCMHNDYEQIKTYVPPFVKLEDTAQFQVVTDQVVADILEFKPDFVLLGLSYPKQEILSLKAYEQLENTDIERIPLFFSLGASYEFYCGMKKRAPKIYQQLGMEWFYRFMQEPRRMWRRYTVDNFRFLLLMRKEIFKKRK